MDQIVIPELRDILPDGTVVDDSNGIRWTRKGHVWESGSRICTRPRLPLDVVFRPLVSLEKGTNDG